MKPQRVQKRKNGMMGKIVGVVLPKFVILLSPIFHFSNVPTFQE